MVAKTVAATGQFSEEDQARKLFGSIDSASLETPAEKAFNESQEIESSVGSLERLMSAFGEGMSVMIPEPDSEAIAELGENVVTTDEEGRIRLEYIDEEGPQPLSNDW